VNVLLTGGAGFVGSVCAECLLADGHKVAIVDNLKTGHREAVPPGVEFFEGDFGDTGLFGEIMKRCRPEAVMHFAGETLVENSMTDPRSYFENNVRKAVHFLNAVLDAGIRSFIFSSTAAVYGNPISTPISEDHPTEPINAYGESKLMFEKVLDWYHRAYGLGFVAVRYFNACGATQHRGEHHEPESHLIPRILDSVTRTGTELMIYGEDYPTPDGTCVRDYVHVQDIAQAHILAMQALKQGRSGIYNIGSGTGYSVRQVVSAVEQAVGHPLKYRVAARRAGDPAILVASSDKLSKELGWKPQHSSLNQIVNSAWAWRQQHPDGYRVPRPHSVARLAV
jgi:UDP-glucose 4-epimerase